MNQAELAKLAGVSQATVSRVLNNHPNVNPEVRMRVLNVMKENRYYPNALARALVTRATQMLGVMVFDIANPFYCEVVRGIEDSARAHGFTVMTCSTDSVPENEERSILAMLQNRVDGIILATVRLSQGALKTLSDSGVPFVLVNRQTHVVACDFIISNNYAGAEEAVRHLAWHGHRRIAHIAGPRDFLATWERLEAYLNVLQELGLDTDHSWVQQGDLSLAGGWLAMERLLKGDHPPTAVFAANDMMAIGAMEAVLDAGLRVPEDIAIVGFDDIRMCSLKSIALTTVRQQKHQMGASAVEVLLNRLRSDGVCGSVQRRLPTELIIRRSCGCTPPSQPRFGQSTDGCSSDT